MGRNEAKKIVTAGLHHIFSLSLLSASISRWTRRDLSVQFLSLYSSAAPSDKR
jgi:hypothetical protein